MLSKPAPVCCSAAPSQGIVYGAYGYVRYHAAVACRDTCGSLTQSHDCRCKSMQCQSHSDNQVPAPRRQPWSRPVVGSPTQGPSFVWPTGVCLPHDSSQHPTSRWQPSLGRTGSCMKRNPWSSPPASLASATTASSDRCCRNDQQVRQCACGWTRSWQRGG